MTKLEFLTKHINLLTEFVELEGGLEAWVQARSDREIHVLAHFMFLCHVSAQQLAPHLLLVSKVRGIDKQVVLPEDL